MSFVYVGQCDGIEFYSDDSLPPDKLILVTKKQMLEALEHQKDGERVGG